MLSNYYISPFRIDRALGNASFISPAIVENIASSHRSRMTSEYINELSNVLDVFILVTYKRAPMTSGSLRDLLECTLQNDFAPLAAAVANDDISFKSLQEQRFKFAMLIAESFQIWRMFTGVTEREELAKHPFSDEMNLRAVLDLFKQNTRSSILVPDETMKLSHYLLQICIEAKVIDYVVKKSRRKVSITAAFDFESLQGYLLSLAGASFTDGNDEKAVMEGFYTMTIFQEVVNLFLESRCLLEGEIAEMEFAASAISLAYRGRDELCAVIAEKWMDGEGQFDYPLVRLIEVLAENTIYEPIYLIKILRSISASATLRALVCGVLNKSVNLTGFVAIDSLRYREDMAFSVDYSRLEDIDAVSSYEPLQWSNFDLNSGDMPSRGTEVIYDGQNGGEAFGLSGFRVDIYSSEEKKSGFYQSDETGASNSMIDFCSPFNGDRGVLIDVNTVTNQAFVRWNTRCPWWTILLQKIADGSSGKQTQLLVEILKLILSIGGDFKSGLYLRRTLESKWMEMAIFQLLKLNRLEDIYEQLLDQYREQGPIALNIQVLFSILRYFLPSQDRLMEVYGVFQRQLPVFLRSIDELITLSFVHIMLDNRENGVKMLKRHMDGHPEQVLTVLLILKQRYHHAASDTEGFTKFVSFLVKSTSDDEAESLNKRVQVNELLSSLVNGSVLGLLSLPMRQDQANKSEYQHLFASYFTSIASYLDDSWNSLLTSRSLVFTSEKLLVCQTLLQLMSTLSYAAFAFGYKELELTMARLYSKEVFEVLLQLAVLLPAVQHRFANVTTDKQVSITMKDLLSTSMESSYDKSSDEAEEKNMAALIQSQLALKDHLEIILNISQMAMTILEMMLIKCNVNAAGVIIEIIGSPLKLWNTLLGLESKTLSNQSATTMRDEEQLSYLAGLFSLLTMRMGSSSIQATKATAGSLLLRLLALKDTSDTIKSSWFLNALRVSNLYLVDRIIASLKQLKGGDDEEHQVILLDVLVKLMECHPTAIAMSFGLNGRAISDIARTDTVLGKRSSSVEGIDLIPVLLSLLADAEGLFKNHPRVLGAVLRFIYQAMIQAPSFPTVGKVILYLIQQSQFWKHVLSPMTADIPKRFEEELQALLTSASSTKMDEDEDSNAINYKKIVAECDEDDDLLQYLHAIKPVDCVQLDEDVQHSVYQSQTIAAALDILAMERYGSLYDLDPEVGLKVTAEVNELYKGQNVKIRFVSWIKGFMKVQNITEHIQALHILRNKLGLASTVDLPRHVNVDMSRGSMEYALWARVYGRLVIQNGKRFVTTNDQANDSSAPLSQLQVQAEMYNHLLVVNCQLTLYQTDMFVLQSFQKFMQVFALPGSRIKEFILRLKSQPTSSEGSSNKRRDINYDHLKPPDSPMIGALSPVTGPNQPDASPISRRESSFSGDKRSYEVANEILNSLHGGDDLALLQATKEKTRLLKVMLHHQLKAVAFRASDPQKSEVSTRDIGSARLTQDKMEKILERLITLYDEMFPVEKGLVFPSSNAISNIDDSALLLKLLSVDSESAVRDMKGVKQMGIRCDIFSIMLMLLSSIHVYDASNEFVSEHAERRRRIVQISYSLLLQSLQHYGVVVLVAVLPDEHDTNSVVFTTARVALQLMFTSLPRAMLSHSHSITDHRRWITNVQEDIPLDEFLIQLLLSLDHASAVGRLDCIALPLSTTTSNGEMMTNILQTGTDSTLKTLDPHHCLSLPPSDKQFDRNVACTTILTVVDLLCRGLHAQFFLTHDANRNKLFLCRLVAQIRDSAVLAQMMVSLQDLGGDYAGLFMGYDANGSDGLAMKVFLRYLTLLESIALSVGENMGVDLQQTIISCLQRHETILLLPLVTPALCRNTVQQLRSIKHIYRLVSSLPLSLWSMVDSSNNKSMEALQQAFIVRAKGWLAKWSLLLPQQIHDETLQHDEEALAQEEMLILQRAKLLGHCLLIAGPEEKLLQPIVTEESEAMKSMLSLLPPQPGAAPTAGGGSAHVRFGVNETFSLASAGSTASGIVTSPFPRTSGGGLQSPSTPTRAMAIQPRSILKHAGGKGDGNLKPMLSIMSGDETDTPTINKHERYVTLVETVAMEMVQALLIVLRQVLEPPFESGNSESSQQMEHHVGQSVFYRTVLRTTHTSSTTPTAQNRTGRKSSDDGYEVFSGTIQRMIQSIQPPYNFSLEVILPDGRIEVIAPEQVVYQRAPPCIYLPPAEAAQSLSSQGYPDLSTAHLIRLLHVSSPLIIQQAALMLLQAVDHIAWAPPMSSEEGLRQALREALQALKRVISSAISDSGGKMLGGSRIAIIAAREDEEAQVKASHFLSRAEAWAMEVAYRLQRHVPEPAGKMVSTTPSPQGGAASRRNRYEYAFQFLLLEFV